MKSKILGIVVSLYLISPTLYAQTDQFTTQQETTTTTTMTPTTPDTTTTVETTQMLPTCTGLMIQKCEDLVQSSCGNYYASVSGGGSHQCTWDETQTPAVCSTDMTSECSHE